MGVLSGGVLQKFKKEKMTKKEKVNRNIGLSFDLMRKMVDNISLIDNIPNGTSIDFVEKDFSEKPKAEVVEKPDITFVKVINDFQVN